MLETNHDVLVALLAELKSWCESAPYRAPEQHAEMLSRMIDIHNNARVQFDVLNERTVEIEDQGWIVFRPESVHLQKPGGAIVWASVYGKQAWDGLAQLLRTNQGEGMPVEETEQPDGVAFCRDGMLVNVQGLRLFFDWEAIEQPQAVGSEGAH